MMHRQGKDDLLLEFLYLRHYLTAEASQEMIKTGLLMMCNLAERDCQTSLNE